VCFRRACITCATESTGILDHAAGVWSPVRRCKEGAHDWKVEPGEPDRSALGLVHFHRIQSGRNNRYIKKIVIETRIYSWSRFNLLIMIGRTRDRRAGLDPHLLTSGLIPSLLVHLSWVNSFLVRNNSGSFIVAIIIFLLHLSIPIGIDPVETNEALAGRLRRGAESRWTDSRRWLLSPFLSLIDNFFLLIPSYFVVDMDLNMNTSNKKRLLVVLGECRTPLCFILTFPKFLDPDRSKFLTPLFILLRSSDR
jgi:hypothetical protein